MYANQYLGELFITLYFFLLEGLFYVGYNRNRSKLSVKRWTRFQINRDSICCILLIIPALSAHSFAGDGENLKRFIYKNGGPVLDTEPPFFIVTRKEVIKNLCHLCTGGLVCRIQFSVASGYNAAFYKGFKSIFRVVRNGCVIAEI